MDAKTYCKITAINLCFLLAGALVGSVVVKSLDSLCIVHAQPADKAPKSAPKTEPAKTSCDAGHFECVSPSISTTTAAFGTLLVNRIASDKLTVNGYDPLKLHDATLSALQSKGILSAADVAHIVNAANVAKPLRVR